MKTAWICILLLVAPLLAQEFAARGPAPAVTSPLFESSVGYTYFALDTPSHQRVFLSGFDANAFVDIRARWGLMADTSYARIGDSSARDTAATSSALLSVPFFIPQPIEIHESSLTP